MSWDTSYKVSVMRICQTGGRAPEVREIDLIPGGIVITAILLAAGLALCWWLGSQPGFGLSAAEVPELPRFRAWVPAGDREWNNKTRS
jgi:hypothetical protein